MGTTTNAILFYGIIDHREDALPWSTDDDCDELQEELEELYFEGVLNKRLGGPPLPRGKYDREAYRKERGDFLASQFDCDVSLVWHCCGEAPMYGIAIASTVRTAHRGYPLQVRELDVPDGAQESLRVACTALGMDYDAIAAEGRIGWWLVSYWV